jgi:mannose-6-phosphate isomerase-like protein (cupin superfamily)
MTVIDLQDCEEFVAGDDSLLRQLLHPDKIDIACRYSLCHAVVKSGQSTIPHRLRTSEVYYILEGKGVMFIDDEVAAVGPGMAVCIPPLSTQYIRSTGPSDLKFLCIVDPAWRQEDEEILT